MSVPDVLRSLLTAAGPSGYEQAPAAVFRDACASFAEVSQDTVGSTVARVRGSGDGPVLAIAGHIDEIGLIVHHIDDDGYLWFTAVGGWDTVVLVGQRLEVLTREGPIAGVVGKRPIHLLDGEERKKAPELKHLHIDIGAKDGDDARSRVRIGDVAVIAGEPVEFPNGRVVSRSMDNRLGCYVAYEAARLVAEAVVHRARHVAPARQLDRLPRDHRDVADPHQRTRLVAGRGADVDVQVLELRDLLAVVLLHQVNRLLADDARDRARARGDRDPLPDEHDRIPAADARAP